MPVVPGLPSASYNPTPDVRADPNATTRPIRIQTDPEMFGSGIGRATQQLGGTLDKIGDEFASTAMQFARLDQETKAAKAATDYYTASGNLDASFRTMTGEDPAKALVRHNQQLSDLREQYRQNLSPYAAKLFDQQTLRSMGYDIRNSSLYSATESKKAATAARGAQIDAKIDQLIRQADTNDDEAVKSTIGEIASIQGQQSVQDGDSKPVLQAKIETQIARAVDGMAKQRAKTDPDGAEQFLKKFEGQIHYSDYAKTLDDIQNKGVTVRAEKDAAVIANPMEALLARAREVTAAQESGSKGYANITTTYSKRLGRNQQALGRYGIMDFDLPEWSQAALGHEVTKEEFMNSPEIQDQIYNHRMGMYIQKYGVEGAGRAWLGGEGAVNNPYGAHDAFGSYPGDYGRIFAQRVGGVQPTDVTKKSLIDMQREVENKANGYYANDPVRRQMYIDSAMRAIGTKVSVQQKEFNEQVRMLENSAHDVLNKKLPSTNRGPTSMEEARSIDPKFDDYVDKLSQLTPGYQQKLHNAFLANAKEDVPETQARTDEYIRVKGMSPTDLQSYDANDAYNKGLITNASRTKIMMDQANVQKKAAQGQEVDRVLLRNHALLNDLNAFPSRSDPNANQRYQWLRGAAMLRMEQWQTDKKSPMPLEEQEKMMKDLSQEVWVKQPKTFLGYDVPFTGQWGRQFEVEGNQPERVVIQNGWRYRADGTPLGPVK